MIILGMLAVTKRHVVANRIETLVKVGIGDKGKVGRDDSIFNVDQCLAIGYRKTSLWLATPA